MAEINQWNWSGSELDVNSTIGSELDSASFVVAGSPAETSRSASLADRVRELKGTSIRKVRTLKREGLEKARSLGSSGTRRLADLKATGRSTVTGYRTRVSDSVLLMRAKATLRLGALRREAGLRGAQMEHHMRTDTAKWAGVASGTGLALGLLGRWMRHRAKIRRERVRAPQLVLVGRAC